MQVCELGELHKHLLVVKLEQPLQLGQVVALRVRQRLVRIQLVLVVVLPVRTQLVLVVVSLEQKPLRQLFQSSQDVLPLQLLYQLLHQLQEVFQQLVKEFLYQPCL
jgi:positive regulator of sigma E activity